MNNQASEKESFVLTPWDPKMHLRCLLSEEVKLSRGFLRCRPEKWFPGFGDHWLPLAHSLGSEIKVVKVEPTLKRPEGLGFGYAGTVDGEPIGISLNSESAQTLLDAVCPEAMEAARSVVLEYLARRALASLARSWSGPESSLAKFHTELKITDVSPTGYIEYTFEIDGHPCTAWFVLGHSLVERLDGLWRRQIRSAVKQAAEPVTVSLEIAKLAVPEPMIAEYTKSGTVVDLEVPVTDSLTLSIDGKPWLPARIGMVQDKLGFEVLPGPVLATRLPANTTRLSVEFGQVALDASVIAEMSQVGAMWQTHIELTDKVNLVVDAKKVGEAMLCSYEGRFAVSVV